jgi:hypothetical protein
MSWCKLRHVVMLSTSMFCLSVVALSGCETKEKVIDIETPAGDIEVERSKGSGQIDVDVDVDRKRP